MRKQLSGETLKFMKVLWDLAHALELRSKRMAKELGVTSPQRLVIRVVGQSPDSTASELAKTLGLHPSTLSGILSRLEDQDVLARKTDDVDRRVARFRLTARGSQIDRERKGTVEAAVRRALRRADAPMIAQTVRMIALVTEELSRGADAPA
jgi:DNA-binding MarR family transcriptional regulator